MARFRRLDPDNPLAVRFTTKLGYRDALRVTALAQRDGMTQSAALRSLVLKALDAEDARRDPAVTGR